MLAIRLAFRTMHIQPLSYCNTLDSTKNYNVQYLLHYLDDFLTAGPPNSPVCKQNLESMLTLCQRINTPIKPEKVVQPSTCVTFLGIVIDTETMTASISNEHKVSILEELQHFLERKNVPNGSCCLLLANSHLPAKWSLLDASFYVILLI